MTRASPGQHQYLFGLEKGVSEELPIIGSGSLSRHSSMIRVIDLSCCADNNLSLFILLLDKRIVMDSVFISVPT